MSRFLLVYWMNKADITMEKRDAGFEAKWSIGRTSSA
jgi:hypothetical protein